MAKKKQAKKQDPTVEGDQTAKEFLGRLKGFSSVEECNRAASEFLPLVTQGKVSRNIMQEVADEMHRIGFRPKKPEKS